MEQVFLSDINLFYSESIEDNFIFLKGEEFRHAVKVLRKNSGDIIYVTNGKGKIFKTKIIKQTANIAHLKILDIKEYKEDYPYLKFVIPLLRKNERLEFALEKLTELGITKIIVYRAERSIKISAKIKRWNKILTSATKQSLRAFIPELNFIESLSKLTVKPEEDIFIFEQKGEYHFPQFNLHSTDREKFLIFGPEGGLTSEEIHLFPRSKLVRLTPNRLRAETAIIVAAVMLQ